MHTLGGECGCLPLSNSCTDLLNWDDPISAPTPTANSNNDDLFGNFVTANPQPQPAHPTIDKNAILQLYKPPLTPGPANMYQPNPYMYASFPFTSVNTNVYKGKDSSPLNIKLALITILVDYQANIHPNTCLPVDIWVLLQCIHPPWGCIRVSRPLGCLPMALLELELLRMYLGGIFYDFLLSYRYDDNYRTLNVPRYSPYGAGVGVAPNAGRYSGF